MMKSAGPLQQQPHQMNVVAVNESTPLPSLTGVHGIDGHHTSNHADGSHPQHGTPLQLPVQQHHEHQAAAHDGSRTDHTGSAEPRSGSADCAEKAGLLFTVRWAQLKTQVSLDGKALSLLGYEEYSTLTRGERHVHPARFNGLAIYKLLKHKRDGRTHIVYALLEAREARPGTSIV